MVSLRNEYLSNCFIFKWHVTHIPANRSVTGMCSLACQINFFAECVSIFFHYTIVKGVLHTVLFSKTGSSTDQCTAQGVAGGMSVSPRTAVAKGENHWLTLIWLVSEKNGWGLLLTWRRDFEIQIAYNIHVVHHHLLFNILRWEAKIILTKQWSCIHVKHVCSIHVI